MKNQAREYIGHDEFINFGEVYFNVEEHYDFDKESYGQRANHYPTLHSIFLYKIVVFNSNISSA